MGIRFKFIYSEDEGLGWNTRKTIFINLAAFDKPNYDFYYILIHEVLVYQEIGDFWKARKA